MKYEVTLNQLVGSSALERPVGRVTLGLLIGAHSFVKNEDKQEVSFMFDADNEKVFFCCKIALNCDLYRMTLLSENSDDDVSFNGLYSEQLKELFENTTGLFLSLC